MDQMRGLFQKIYNRCVKSIFMSLIFTAALTSCCIAHAHEGHGENIPDSVEWPDDRNVTFEYTADSSDEFYSIYNAVWTALEPLYKGTKRDKNKPDSSPPIIGHTEYDLNGDRLPETIAYHMESEDEKGQFCKKSGLCPFYIIDFLGKQPRLLGIIPARSIDRGDSIKNGYWTLKVFDSQKDFAQFKIYEYKSDKTTYAPASGGK